MTTATAEKSNGRKSNGTTADEVQTDTRTIAERLADTGLAKVTLGDIRDETGHARIGRKVLASMAEYLADQDLGVLPAWVMDPFQNPEPRQWQVVHVYKRDGSVKSQVLDAFADPDKADLTEALSALDNGTPDYKKMSNPNKIALIRSIVCE